MRVVLVVLGLLGLVCALAMPSASAAVLLQEDFNDGKFQGVGGVYTQGLGAGTDLDPPLIPFTVRQFAIVDDIQELTDPEVITNGVLDWGNGDSIAEDADPENTPRLRHLLLTGEPAWADVAIQSKLWSLDQRTGVLGLVLRAAPKTKPEDPDTWYELRYTTDNSIVTPQETASGIEQPVDSDPNLRILKVVNGKWTKLAETDNNVQTSVVIPSVYNTGEDQLTGMIMRFVVKGSLLQGFVGLPGKPLQKVIEANDGELKAGRVGFHQYNFRPLSDDLLVEDAP